jgi:hypothetical protein
LSGSADRSLDRINRRSSVVETSVSNMSAEYRHDGNVSRKKTFAGHGEGDGTRRIAVSECRETFPPDVRRT